MVRPSVRNSTPPLIKIMIIQSTFLGVDGKCQESFYGPTGSIILKVKFIGRDANKEGLLCSVHQPQIFQVVAAEMFALFDVSRKSYRHPRPRSFQGC